jgi:hypothetical protein
MKGQAKKLSLHRDTVRGLTATQLQAAAGGAKTTNPCTNYVTCVYTACNDCTVSCATCNTCLTCAGC